MDFDKVSGSFDDKVVEYLGLDKTKIEQEFGSTFGFVYHFLHPRVFHADLDFYGENAQPFHNIINGVNQLIEAGLEARVLTARNIADIEKYEKGIVEKTHHFVNSYLSKVSEIIFVDKTPLKEAYIHDTDYWIDDNYEVLLEQLLTNNVFIVKHQYPRNEALFAHSVITDRHSPSQPFIEDILNHHKTTGKKGITVDLDNTLISWCGRFKEVCDYAKEHYGDILKKYLP